MKSETSISLPAPQSSTDELAIAIAKKLAENNPPSPPVQTKPCRGDDLSACSDEALIEWGEPLVQAISRIYDRCSEKPSEEPKGADFLAEVRQKDNRAADEYRECCAEDALKYKKELAARIGGGYQSNSLTEWTSKLMNPIGSSEWETARRGGCTNILLLVRFDLRLMVLDLQRKRIRNPH